MKQEEPSLYCPIHKHCKNNGGYRSGCDWTMEFICPGYEKKHKTKKYAMDVERQMAQHFGPPEE